jgi:hypothetical protein
MSKLPRHFAPLTFAICMSCVMVFIMSGFITALNTGFANGFIARWMVAFISAWPVAFVCVFVFAGRVRKFVGRICES